MRTGRLLGIAAALWFGHTCLSLADVTKVYEWREASGVLSFAQAPPPPETKGVTVRVIDGETFTPAQRLAIRLRLYGLDAEQQAAAKRLREQVADADRTVSLALQRLSGAERAVRSGRTPWAGERIGNAGGGTRLKASYFDRLRTLESSAEDARAGVERAYRQRAELAR